MTMLTVQLPVLHCGGGARTGEGMHVQYVRAVKAKLRLTAVRNRIKKQEWVVKPTHEEILI